MNQMSEVMIFNYFMWNYFNEQTCWLAFADAFCGAEYLWKRYVGMCENYGSYGAAPAFLSYLDARNQNLLITYAIKFMREKGYEPVLSI